MTHILYRDRNGWFFAKKDLLGKKNGLFRRGFIRIGVGAENISWFETIGCFYLGIVAWMDKEVFINNLPEELLFLHLALVVLVPVQTN